MKGAFRLLAALAFALTSTACQDSASGTYVAHSPTFTEMLQLTETGNGQLTGIVSAVRLKEDGEIDPDQMQVTGAINAGQLTLTIHSIIFGLSLAGTLSGNRIQLETVDSKGNVSTESLVRTTPAQFKIYADELKSKGEGIVLSGKLLSKARELRDAVRNADNWIANAEMHASRIPAAEAQYDNIEGQMRALVAREKASPNAVARTQISVAVIQGDVAGGQVDIQLEQIWDIGIANSGSSLSKEFTEWDRNCGTRDQLQKRGASSHAIDEWEGACKQALVEREKFIPIFKRTMEQRSELKSLETLAGAHRKALVQQADNLQ